MAGREAFEQVALQRGAMMTPRDVERLAGWFRLRGFSQERKGVTVHLGFDVSEWSEEQLGQAKVIQGVTLDVEGVDWVNDLNRHLRQRKLVALICLRPPEDVIYRLNLPPMFEVHRFVDLHGLMGSISFARQALMLQVAMQERRFIVAVAPSLPESTPEGT